MRVRKKLGARNFDRNIFDSAATSNPMHAPRRRKESTVPTAALRVFRCQSVGDRGSPLLRHDLHGNCRNLSQNRVSPPGNVEESNHGDPRLRPPLLLPLPRGITTHRTRVPALSWGPLPPHATHLMRFFDRMRGALTAAPTRLLPVNHIPHAAPTTLSPKPKAMPKLA